MRSKINILTGIGGLSILVVFAIFISTFGYAQEEIIENGNEVQLLIEDHIMPDYLKVRFENAGARIEYINEGTHIAFNHEGSIIANLKFRRVITQYQRKIVEFKQDTTIESFQLDLPERCIRYGTGENQVASFDLTYDSQSQQASYSLRQLNDPICK